MPTHTPPTYQDVMDALRHHKTEPGGALLTATQERNVRVEEERVANQLLHQRSFLSPIGDLFSRITVRGIWDPYLRWVRRQNQGDWY